METQRHRDSDGQRHRYRDVDTESLTQRHRDTERQREGETDRGLERARGTE